MSRTAILHDKKVGDSAGGQKLELRRIRLKYAGQCERCWRGLEQGGEAFYDAAARQVYCTECALSTVVVETGVAGRSAQQKHQQLKTAHETRIKGKWGNFLGGIVLGLSGEPREVANWQKGAIGEQKLGVVLSELKEVRALHDRVVPHTRGNIDHLLVAPGGVFVVDAKHYQGLIRVREMGGWFKRDSRLYVGRIDCSGLAEGMDWQMTAVRRSLEVARLTVPLSAVVCFIDGQWPMFLAPKQYRGVWLESQRSLKKRLIKERILKTEQIERVWRMLGLAFPAK